MRLTVEFDTEWWRVRHWWRRVRCRVGGHPGFEDREPPMFFTSFLHGFGGPPDPRPRCTRCGEPDPSLPEPKAPDTITYSFDV